MKESMCNIPEELLTRQLIIDTIPDIIILLMLFIACFTSIFWYLKEKDSLPTTYSRTVLICLFVVWFPLFYKCSFIMKTTATNIFNSEYAALIKFTQGCPNSLK